MTPNILILFFVIILLTSCNNRYQDSNSFNGPQYYGPYKEHYYKSIHRHHKHYRKG